MGDDNKYAGDEPAATPENKYAGSAPDGTETTTDSSTETTSDPDSGIEPANKYAG